MIRTKVMEDDKHSDQDGDVDCMRIADHIGAIPTFFRNVQYAINALECMSAVMAARTARE